VTLDESWFYISTDHEFIWLRPDEEIPKRERQTVQSEKVMLIIVWNPSGFHLIRVLPKEFKFSAGHYVAQILGPLPGWHRIQVGRTNRKLTVHADNARPHTGKLTLVFMEQNVMKRAPSPPCSPDLAPFDFYLFGYVKHHLSGSGFADADSLPQAVSDILGCIEKAPWKASFAAEWKDCADVVPCVESLWSKKLLYTNIIS
jgi:hypothetical protein